MGKGDKKTKKGKRFSKSFGVHRSKKKYSSIELFRRKNSYYRKKFSKKSSFKKTKQSDVITELTLALVSEKNGFYYSSGSAVIIAPYLAITAKHIIEDFFNKYDNKDKKTLKNKTGEIKGTFSLTAFQTLGGEKDKSIWSITRMWPCASTDIYFLRLTPASQLALDYKWKKITLDFKTVKVGERVSAFGYGNSKYIKEKSLNNLTYEASTSVGEIIEVYPEKRDSSRLNFPCFMTNSRYDGGMSGGPVFNERGFLCGLICSSLPARNINEEDVSYVSLLKPILMTQIDIPYIELGQIGIYPILKLVEEGIISAVDYET
ncbi:30S ribosomal protein THX [Winogradskyella sp.]|uniref:30S ribosomal protein THX n=1 Tax=Winogradskyella sp. TaxID=1883156 RepID=UPI002615FF99|nr:30S ribosomal protein THX [Winogradskyella sp.]